MIVNSSLAMRQKLKDELLVRIQKLEYERMQLKIEESGIEEKQQQKQVSVLFNENTQNLLIF